MACIFGNTIVLCVSWYGVGKKTVKVTDYFNYTFMCIFAMEAIVKTIALDKHYFHEKWNIFDFVVVVTTAFVVLLESLNIGSIGKQASVLRSLRILRVLRIFKKFKRL
jgi:sodium/hydrogen exchanger 10/11